MAMQMRGGGHQAETDLLPENLLDEDDGGGPGALLRGRGFGGLGGFGHAGAGLLQVQSHAHLPTDEELDAAMPSICGVAEDIARDQGRAHTAPARPSASSPLSTGPMGADDATEAVRRHPDYSTWYHSQHPRDPRAPPPLPAGAADGCGAAQQPALGAAQHPAHGDAFDPWAMLRVNMQGQRAPGSGSPQGCAAAAGGLDPVAASNGSGPLLLPQQHPPGAAGSELLQGGGALEGQHLYDPFRDSTQHRPADQQFLGRPDALPAPAPSVSSAGAAGAPSPAMGGAAAPAGAAAPQQPAAPQTDLAAPHRSSPPPPHPAEPQHRYPRTGGGGGGDHHGHGGGGGGGGGSHSHGHHQQQQQQQHPGFPGPCGAMPMGMPMGQGMGFMGMATPQQQLATCKMYLNVMHTQQVALQQQYQQLLQQQHTLQASATANPSQMLQVNQKVQAVIAQLGALSAHQNWLLQQQQVLQAQAGAQGGAQPKPPQSHGQGSSASSNTAAPGIAPSLITSGQRTQQQPQQQQQQQQQPGRGACGAGGPCGMGQQQPAPALGWGQCGGGGVMPQSLPHQHHHQHQQQQHQSQPPQQQQQSQPGPQRGERGKGRRREVEKGGSQLMEEFRQQKTRLWEVQHLIGHIVEFSRDQDGSRLIQRKLETAGQQRNSAGDQALTAVFLELQPHALNLMSDVFGNYVIQKLLEHGLQEHRIGLARAMQGNVVNLTLQTYGCRVMQKALEVVPPPLRDQLAAELDGHVPHCVQDQNGNHVIQKCIEKLPNTTTFIATSFLGQIRTLGQHAYGCRVLQRILEHVRANPNSPLAVATRPVVDEVIDEIYSLVTDQNGNYVVQHVLLNGDPQQIHRIVAALRPKIGVLSQHKFASNVIEKVVEHSTPALRSDITHSLIASTGPDGSSALLVMIQNQFANYVVQKMLDLADDHTRRAMVEHIRPFIPVLRRGSYGKHIISRIEKLDAQRAAAHPPAMVSGALPQAAAAAGFVPHAGTVLK